VPAPRGAPNRLHLVPCSGTLDGVRNPTVPAGLPADLPAGVLRVAAALPAGGPRAGDLRPVAACIGQRVGAWRVVLDVSDPTWPREHLWTAPGADERGTLGGEHGLVTLAHPVFHHGVEVATLAVTLPAAGVPSAGRPIAWAAAVLGVVVRTAVARAASGAARRHAQQTLARIADTRYRAASQMESERHALERDLHDGAQLHLVSLQLAAAVVEHALEHGTADESTLPTALADLGARLDRTHQVLVETAAGITPGPLRDGGLAAALAVSFGEAHDVTLHIAPAVRTRRYPPIVESTVYLTCLEAVSNAQKHAPGAAVTVSVRGTYQGLSFEVTDSGPGLDAATTGLANLRARLAAIGGTLQVISAPGTGTRLAASVPL
jgi:signal transduction histidine kinase